MRVLETNRRVPTPTVKSSPASDLIQFMNGLCSVFRDTCMSLPQTRKIAAPHLDKPHQRPTSQSMSADPVRLSLHPTGHDVLLFDCNSDDPHSDTNQVVV